MAQRMSMHGDRSDQCKVDVPLYKIGLVPRPADSLASLRKLSSMASFTPRRKWIQAAGIWRPYSPIILAVHGFFESGCQFRAQLQEPNPHFRRQSSPGLWLINAMQGVAGVIKRVTDPSMDIRSKVAYPRVYIMHTTLTSFDI